MVADLDDPVKVEAARWQHLNKVIAGGYEVIDQGQWTADALHVDGTWV